MRKMILAACGTALLTGCATYREPDTAGFVRLNQTATVGPVRVTPLAVLEDSRCPQDVQCVWAGRVRIDARVEGARQELTLGEPVAVAGGTLELSEVRPPRLSTEVVASNDYRFRLTFR